MDESDKKEAEKAQRRRAQQRFASFGILISKLSNQWHLNWLIHLLVFVRHGFSNGQQSDSFYTTLDWDDIKLPRGSSTDSTKTSSSVESSTDISSRSSGSFWDRKGSWSWGSGDSGGGDSCSGGGDCGGGD